MQKKTKELKRTLKAVSKKSPFDFPNRLWESIVLIWIETETNGLIYQKCNYKIYQIS
jgi:hypothetical protein